MSILSEILTWSKTRPMWQRDVLRRIIAGDEFTDGVYHEVTELCLKERVYPEAGKDLIPVPLDENHVANLAATADTVILQCVSDVKRVNVLAGGKELGFAAAGLTVVYGDNGSGKSGYGRILKSVCRTRSKRSPVHPNVYEPAPKTPPSATIKFTTNGQAETFEWKGANEAPVALKQVSFFDAGSIGQYVETKTNVAYRPSGLDILPTLVAVCDEVRTRIQARIANIGDRLELEGLNEGTSSKKFFDGMTHKTKPDDAADACTITKEMEQRIAELKEMLTAVDTDAVKSKVKDLRAKAKRLTTLSEDIDRIAGALADVKVDELKNAITDAVTKAEAAQLAGRVALADVPLGGVGGPAWQQLWKAARKYSLDVAYPGQAFPVVEGEAVCVLCQQPLQPDAAARLSRFDNFIKQEVQRAADAAMTSLEVLRSAIETLKVPKADECSGLDDLSSVNEVAHQLAVSFLDAMEKRRLAILRAYADGDWSTVDPALPGHTDAIRAFAQSLEDRAIEVEKTAQPDAEKNLRAELLELEDRELLASNRKNVLKDLSRLMLKSILGDCHSDAATQSITIKNRDMTRDLFTQELRQRFDQELRELDLGHLALEVKDLGGQKGEMYYQVEIAGKQIAEVKASEILSEGEHRCIALAAFFTELAMQESGSTIIFDDPVCSLDHGRREAVARRLVKEAKRRPVVVLTHDVVFLLNVHEIAEQEGIAFSGAFLECRGNDRGVPMDGLPWKGQSLSKRTGWLKNEMAALEKCYKDETREAYAWKAAPLWGRLREAWECGVEEVLLNGAVMRFGRGVSTLRLEKIHDITPQDLQAVERGMTESSKWFAGHTEAADINAPMPAPTVLAQAIEDLEKWRKDIVGRRK